MPQESELGSEVIAQGGKDGPFGHDLKYDEAKETPEFLVELLMKQIGDDVEEPVSEVGLN